MKTMSVEVIADQKDRCPTEFIGMAKSEADENAWLLYETTKQAGLVRLNAFHDIDITYGTIRLTVFSGHMELRFEKEFSAEKGSVRRVRINTPQGKKCYVREGKYLLHSSSGIKGNLIHYEFFCPDAVNGFLVPYCECLAGIKESAQ